MNTPPLNDSSLTERAKQTILRGVSADMASSIALMLLNLVVAAQCIKTFGTGYGNWLASFSLLSIVAFFEFGTSQFFIREFSIRYDNDQEDNKIGELLGLIVVVAVTLGIFIAVIGNALVGTVLHVTNAQNVDENFIFALQFYAVVIGISVPLALFKQLLIATQKAGTYGLMGMIDGLVMGSLTIILLQIFPYYSTLVISQLIALVITAALSWYLLPRGTIKPLRIPPIQLFWVLTNYCRSIVTARICFVVRERTDQPIVAHFLGPEAVVVYMVTQKLVRVPITLLGSITSSAFAPLARLHALSSSVEFSKFFFQMIMLVVFGSFAGAIGCILFNELFVSLWVGHSYYGGLALSIVMALWLPAEAISRGFGSVLWSINHTNPLVRSHLLESILNLTLSILAAPVLGLVGVALGTLLSSLFSTIWIVPHAVIKHLDAGGLIDLPKRALKYLICLICFAGVAGLIAFFFNWKTIEYIYQPTNTRSN